MFAPNKRVFYSGLNADLALGALSESGKLKWAFLLGIKMASPSGV